MIVAGSVVFVLSFWGTLTVLDFKDASLLPNVNTCLVGERMELERP
jgi:hypothetical protein